MKVLNESLVPVRHPYHHLAYLAATAPLPEPQKAFLATGILFLGVGLIFLRRVLLSHLVPLLATAGVIGGILGFAVFKNAVFHEAGEWSSFLVRAGFLTAVFGGLGLGLWWQHRRAEERNRTLSLLEQESFAQVLFGAPMVGKYFTAFGCICIAMAYLSGNPVYLRPDLVTGSHLSALAREIRKQSGATPGNPLQLTHLPGAVRRDGWNTEVRITPTAVATAPFLLTSAGPDRIFETPDDSVFTVSSLEPLDL
jgi:hypothetical protein